MAKHYVYILLSESRSRTYVGHSDNFDRRFAQHNAGKVRSTKGFRPWRVLHIELYFSLAEAKSRELWYKTRAGREHIAVIIRDLGLLLVTIAW